MDSPYGADVVDSIVRQTQTCKHGSTKVVDEGNDSFDVLLGWMRLVRV